jgi:CBS domain-containing protein
MREIVHNTPLFALDAVAVDTETTGLNPRTARIIEIGAVALARGKLQDATFQSLVAIPERIPREAVAIHGITDAELSRAPAFGAAYEELIRFIGPRVVIGHTFGFDLAVFRRECALAQIAPASWPILDTRLLAHVADPTLPDFSLEAVASWLGLEVAHRHRALADARLTAAIFVALVPPLRGAGIRTFGEAREACRAQTTVLEASSPPVFVAETDRLRVALAKMIDDRISSVFVGDVRAPSSAAGIVTERDILRLVAARGADALDEPVGSLASRPLVTVPADAFTYRAMGRMRRFHVRHLAVTGEDDRVIGAVSARDLLRFRTEAATVLGDDIDEAADVAALAQAWAKVPAMAASLLREEVGARDIAAVIGRELGALTRRSCELAELRLMADGRGGAPCPYALLVLGSAGRGESLLALDQDHALIFEHGEPDGPEDHWFATLGKHMADILHEVGVPYCPGGVMASNASYRGSMATWRRRIQQWIDRGEPQDLLNVDIFFDFRPVSGEGGLAAALWDEAWAAARGAHGFLKLMGEANSVHESPFGLFGRLRAEEGRIDLKRYGLRPIVVNARLLALRHGVAARSTLDRLEGVLALHVGGASDLAAAVAIHKRFLDLILRAQLADIAAGRPASNRVPLQLIEERGGQSRLKADLRLAGLLDDLALDQLAEHSPQR